MESRSSFGGACVIAHWQKLGQYLVPPGNFAWTVLILYYICSVVAESFMASSRSSEMDQAGPSYAPSDLLPGTFLGLALDLRSDRLYDLAPDIPDVMGLRALRPSAAILKVMSVPDSRCIRVVTLFMFMSRYQHDLERMRKECKERFGCTQSGNCAHCGKYIQRDLGKHIALYHLELAWNICGVVQLCGAQYRRGPLRTVLITCGELTLFL